VIVLAFDTSTARGSVAIARKGDAAPLALVEWDRSSSHGEHLTPAIEECLRVSGLKLSNIDALAIGHGPGSFTGVRITINAARAFAFAAKKPIYSYDTTEILNANLALTFPDETRPVLALVNAHKNLIYSSSFRKADDLSWKRELPLSAREVAEFDKLLMESHICIGDAFDEYGELFAADTLKKLVRHREVSDFPSALALARLAQHDHAHVQPLDWNAVQALYVRASSAEENLGVKREVPSRK
jgi:tRNA threonylcarbamoyladenosine biosynthesis protein TsaB